MTESDRSTGACLRGIGTRVLLALGLLQTACPGCRRDKPASSRIEEKTMTRSNDQDARPRGTNCPAGLVDARRGGSAPDRYVAPTDAERAAMTELAASLARRGADPSALASKAHAIGYRLEGIPEMPGTVLLREREGERRGGGAYVFRLGAISPLFVQAPHTFFDEGTLPLSCEFFERARAAALFIDTAHRYKAAQIDDSGEYPADVAHANGSLFQAATAGILAVAKGSTVVQLHGFGPREGEGVIVLSTGVADLGQPLLARTRDLLAPAAQGRIERFPDDTADLGATTNVQGALVRSAGGRFLHVEMSAALRRALLSSPEARSHFLDALMKSVESP